MTTICDTIKVPVEITPGGSAEVLATYPPAFASVEPLCKECNSKPMRYPLVGLCHTCYCRKRSGGAVRGPRPRKLWSAWCTYATAHTRCKQLWGSASLYSCVDCGSRARDWGYDGTDPHELYGQSGNREGKMAYSAWPEFYMPLCREHHSLRDGIGINDEW